MWKLHTCAEPPICCQTAPECTKPRIKFQKISGGDTRGPHTLGVLSPDPWERGGRERGRREGKGRGEGGGKGKWGREGRRRGNSFVAAPSTPSCRRLWIFLERSWIISLLFLYFAHHCCNRHRWQRAPLEHKCITRTFLSPRTLLLGYMNYFSFYRNANFDKNVNVNSFECFRFVTVHHTGVNTILISLLKT